MLTEIVTVKLPAGMTRDEVISNFETTAPTWRENPDLIRKNYLFDADKGVAGGIYLWREEDSRGEVARCTVPKNGERDLRFGTGYSVLRNTDCSRQPGW